MQRQRQSPRPPRPPRRKSRRRQLPLLKRKQPRRRSKRRTTGIGAQLAEFDAATAREHNACALAGVDEVGRGPLAGPVVVCACMPDPKLYPLLGSLNDSKKLSPKKREELFAVLTSGAGAKYALAMASPADIDSINILRATLRSMREAVLKLAPPAESLVLVDGNQKIPELPLRQMTLVKGDGRSLCIAAASVIAKVTRDRMMVEMDSRYPGYGFANHKGYGTAEHYAALEKLGPCPEHRRSFLPLWHNTTR